MKKTLITGALIGLMTLPISANAQGVSTVKFEGNTNVNVGEEFKVNMVLDNISDTDDGIVAFGGYISYDKTVLEIVNTEQADSGYEVMINEGINKIAAIDYSLTNGIKERTNVYTITFKAIDEGNTTITLNNFEIDDKSGIVDSSVVGLNVTSNKVEEVVTEEVKPEVKEEIIEETKEEVKPVVEVKENVTTSENTTVETNTVEKVEETTVEEPIVESKTVITKSNKNIKNSTVKVEKKTIIDIIIDFIKNLFNI